METNNNHGSTCNCMGCQWNDVRAHHAGYRLARKIFVLLLLVAAFAFGTRYGEVKTIEGQWRMHSQMMQNAYGTQVEVHPTMMAVPATPAATSAAR